MRKWPLALPVARGWWGSGPRLLAICKETLELGSVEWDWQLCICGRRQWSPWNQWWDCFIRERVSSCLSISANSPRREGGGEKSEGNCIGWQWGPTILGMTLSWGPSHDLCIGGMYFPCLFTKFGNDDNDNKKNRIVYWTHYMWDIVPFPLYK